MPESSLEELKRRIATGEYAIDSGKLADTIISKLGVIRRVGRILAAQDEDAPGEASGGRLRRTRGGSPSSPQHRLQSR